MINIPLFKGQSFSKLNYDDLINELDNISFFKKEALLPSAGDRGVYGYYTDDVDKPFIFIDGVIHKNHEWRSAYWILQFMRIIDNPDLYSVPKYFYRLRQSYNFYFIPIVSPDNYIKTIGDPSGIGNDNGVDIAENFDFMWEQTNESTRGPFPFSENESTNIKNVVEDKSPVLYINNHAWGSLSGFTIRRPKNRDYELLFKDMFDSLFISSGVGFNTDATYSPRLNNSSSYNWVGTKSILGGRKTLSLVFEVGTKEDLGTQISYGVTGLLINCLIADNYLKTSRQRYP